MQSRPSLALDESRPIWKAMAIFLVPLMLSNLLQSASATINSIFLGRLIGVEALAAASAFFPLLFFMVSFLVGIASGSTVLIGQAFGARNVQRMDQIAGTTLGMTIALGFIVAVLGAVFVHPLLALMGTPLDIIANSASYARIIFLSLPILFVYLIYTTFLRGTGDSQTPFYFLILSTILSAIATPALILGWLGLPRMGVESAAVAGVFANGIGLVALLAYLKVRHHPLAPDRQLLADIVKVDWPTAWLVVKIGVPTGIQLVMASLSEIAVISFVNRYGSDATAAYGAVNQVVSYVQFPAISIGITASIFGAQSIGARRMDRLGAIVRAGVGLSYAIEGALVFIVYAFSWLILSLFLTTEHTLDIARTLLNITLWSYLIFGNSAVLSGVMRSSGSVLWPTTLSILSIWVVEVPCAYALSYRLGIDGIWIAYPIAFATNLLLQSTYYFRFWKRREVKALV